MGGHRMVVKAEADKIVDDKIANGGTTTWVGTVGYIRDIQAVMTKEELEGVTWMEYKK